MRFFIQGDESRLIALNELTDYEYFQTVKKSDDQKAKESLFQSELDFAFFAARLGWSRKEYESMTPVQRMFVLKALEDETVRQSELLKSACELAIANCLGGKKHKYLKLWKSKKDNKPDKPPVSKSEMQKLKEIFASMKPAKKQGGD